MENFVFNVPISAQHPYEHNLSDYDDYFLRDLDIIFQQQQPELTEEFSGAADNTVNQFPAVIHHHHYQSGQQGWAADETFFDQIVLQQEFTNVENVASNVYNNYTPIDETSCPQYVNAVPNNPHMWSNAVDIEVQVQVNNAVSITNDNDDLLDLDLSCNSAAISCNNIELEHANLSTYSAVAQTLDQYQENTGEKNNDTTEEPLILEPIPPHNAFTCEVCTKSYATKRALTCHIARSSACRTATSNLCEQCGKSFPTRRGLQAHIKQEHKCRTVRKVRKQPQPKHFSCPLCTQSFTTRNARNQHKRSHKSLEEIARISESTTTSAGSSSDPASVPDGQRRSFPCDLCARTFAYRTLLQHHRATEHAPLPRFPCQIGFCDQVFRNETLLQRHVQLRHPNNDDTIKRAADGDGSGVKSDAIVRCPHSGCNKSFDNVLLLRRHQTLHRLRTYRCAACGRQYHSRAVYETHVRLSHPKRLGTANDHDDVVLVADEDVDSGPMECVACNQLFENRRVLRLHRQFCADDDGVAAAAEAAEAAERRVQLTGNPIAIEEVYVKQEPMENLHEFMMEE